MSHIRVEESFEYAQKLCARTSTFVHLYETNTVTSGDIVLEIKNPQIGMGNLHSTLACSAGVTAAVLACIDPEHSGEWVWQSICSCRNTVGFQLSKHVGTERCLDI